MSTTNINQLNDSVQLNLINWIQLNKNQIGLGSVPDSILSESLNKLMPGLAKDYTKNIFTSTNQALNVGPAQILGSVNPFNTTTGNQTSLAVASAVLNSLGTQGQTNLQTNLISQLLNGLQAQLGQYGTDLNFASIQATFTSLSKDLFSDLNIESSTSFINGIQENNYFAEDFLPIEDIQFSGEITDPEEDLDELDTNYSKSATQAFLAESKRFDVQEDVNLEKLEVTKKGFTDPTATYPTKEYENISEINKLAQGEPVNSLVQKKNQNLLQSAPLPGNQFFSEPPSAYKAEYPFNKVTETEQGHVIEIDDTPGSERIHVYHKAGTYIEIDRDGNTVFRRKGSDYQIIDKNGYVSIAGHLNLSVAGSVNLFTGNSANIEIIGDAKITAHNDLDMLAGGNINISANDTISFRATDIRLEADRDYDILIDGNIRQQSNVLNVTSFLETYMKFGKDFHAKGEKKAKVEFDDNVNIKSKKKLSLFGQTKLELRSLTAVTTKSPAGGTQADATGMNIRSSGPLNIDASTIRFQENSSISLASLDFDSETPDTANLANHCYAGLLPGRRDFVHVDVRDSFAPTMSEKISLLSEEETDDPDTQAKLKEQLISKGIITEEQFNANPVEQSNLESPKSTNTQVITPSEFCRGLTEAPDNFKLSPNFTLGMLTNRAPCSPTPLVSQSGLSYGQILENLQALALNILDPIFNLYPSMLVTSAFRPVGNNSNSQHPKGQAADIQFKGISPSEYFKIANLLAQSLNYDQLLLEYSNYTNNPWIHVSFTFQNKNRGQAMTFWNNRKYKDGIIKLI